MRGGHPKFAAIAADTKTCRPGNNPISSVAGRAMAEAHCIWQ